MTPSSDGLLSSILNDDDLQLMDPAMGADGKKNQKYSFTKTNCMYQ